MLILGNFLPLLLLTLLFRSVLQINRIRNLITPSVDFSNAQVGYITLKSTWEAEINTDLDTLDTLTMRVQLPFAIGTPLEVKWAKVNNTCDKLPTRTSITSIAIPGDLPNAYTFQMTGAAFNRSGTYYTEMKMPLPAAGAGFTDPIAVSLISTPSSKDFITYAYHSAFANMYISSNGGTGLVIDTSPSLLVENRDIITRVFEGLIDITIAPADGERLLFKLDNHLFANDAAQTCEVKREVGYFQPGSADYDCYFEDDEKTGVFFVLNTGQFPAGAQMRLMLKIHNPSLPTTSSLNVALLRRFSPDILQYVTQASAFSCSFIDFETSYPQLFYGPGLLTSTQAFEDSKITLFTSGTTANAVLFNSVRVDFKLKFDLPEPTLSYTVELMIKGSSKTSLPQSFVYENLRSSKATKKIIVSVIKGGGGEIDSIKVEGVGSLSALNTYSIGFKIALEGDEAFAWTGAGAFGAIKITDSSGAVVVDTLGPQGLKANAQVITTNGRPSNNNMPTLFHSLPLTATDADFVAISDTNYGLRKMDEEQFFFIRANFVRTGAYINSRNWIEVLTNKVIKSNSILQYTAANKDSNCMARKQDGASIPTLIENCQQLNQNKGSGFEEYSRFRIGGNNNNFWASSAANHHYYGLPKVSVTYQNSLFLDDKDTVILDAYINLYAATPDNDVNNTAFGVPTTQYFDNMLVQSPSLMNEIRFDLPNYHRSNTAGQELTGATVPSLLRVSGVLNGVNTIAIQKILLFFEDFEPLFLDSSKTEIGCSNSDSFLVRCFYHQGLPGGSRACGGGTCTNPLYRDRIEVHFTTDTISLANSEHIQLLIPITFPTGAPATNIDLSLGVATIHTGGFNDYNKITHFRKMPLIVPPASHTTLAAANIGAGDVNSASSIKNRVVLVDSAIPGMVGGEFNSKIDMDCNSATVPECLLTTAGQFYSISICAAWNFMEGSKLEVENNFESFPTETTYKKCVSDIRYEESATSTKRWCLWCSIWRSGQVEDFRFFKNFKNPNQFNNLWPAGTYGALSGRNDLHGLYRVTNMNQQIAPAFVPNLLRNFNILPTIWYRGFKSMRIQLLFTTSNPIYSGGSVIIKSNTIMPFSFAEAANSFCFLRHGTDYSVKSACTATKTGIEVTVMLTGATVPTGNVQLQLFGVEVDAVIADSSASFSVRTTTALGVTVAETADQSAQEAFIVRFEDHPSGTINRLKMDTIEYGNDDKLAISSIKLSILVGNDKRLYVDDRLYIDLGTAGYATGSKPVWCYVVNAAGQILTDYQICNVDDLSASFYVASEQETKESLFFVILENYFMPSAPAQAQAALKVFDGSAFNDAQVLLALKDLPAVRTLPGLANFGVAKTLNHKGANPTYKFTVRTAATSVKYKTTLEVTFEKSFYPEMAENIHSCAVENSAGDLVEIFCISFKQRVLRISGFPTDIPASTTFIVHFQALTQGAVTGTQEVVYAALYDEAGELKESKQATTTLPSTLSSVNPSAEPLFDLTFSSSFIRATNTLEYKFRPASTIPSGAKVVVFLDYFSYEYLILPTTLTCSVKANGGGEAATKCLRLGKRVSIELGAALPTGAEVVVQIENLVTPNYETCNMRKITQYVEVGGTIKHLQLGQYLNTKLENAIIDPSLIYLNFKGLSSTSFIRIRRGVYNALQVVRMDESRFNDELEFTLLKDFNGQFQLLNPTQVSKVDSYLGETSIPIKFGCTKDALLSVYLLKLEKKERFKADRFAPLPFLVIENQDELIRLPVPETVTVFRSYESLPLTIFLPNAPIQDLSLSVSIETFDSSNDLELKSPASLTMNKDKELEQIFIKSNHPISSEPIQNTNSRLVIKPIGDSPYVDTYVDIVLKDLVVDTSTRFSVETTSVSASSCKVNLKIHMPLTLYYYIVPKTLFAELSLDWIRDQIKAGIRTDGLITYGVLQIEKSLFDYDLCGGQLMAETDYEMKVWFETFVVQSLNSTAAAAAAGTLSDTWDPLTRPNITLLSDLAARANEIRRLDKGSVTATFRTATNQAGMGYIDLEFDTALSKNQISEICCFYCQALSYPLENIWSSDGNRCPSNQLDNKVEYFAGVNYTSPARRMRRRLLMNRRLQTGGLTNTTTNSSDEENANPNQVRLFVLKNLRPSQDQLAFPKLSSVIFTSTFDSEMASQYSLPTLNSKAPLLQASLIEAEFESFANITIMEDRTSVTVNRIKLKHSGFVYGIVVEVVPGLDALMTYQHIRAKKNPLGDAAAVVFSSEKYFETINEEMNFLVSGLKVDNAYVVYYYGTTSTPNNMPRVTHVYKYEFSIKGTFRNALSGNLSSVYSYLLIAMITFLVLGDGDFQFQVPPSKN